MPNMRTRKPDLSIIIPVLNERDNIDVLVAQLLVQRDITLEIILIDGGSTDGSYERCCQLTDQYPDQISCLQSERGRAVQMNLGADYARAKDVLFLHADTKIEDTTLMYRARSALNQARQQQPDQRFAGHFALRFLRKQQDHKQAYYFYEAKTHLNRPDTINGDQGMFISLNFFRSLGRFDETLPYMEDARLAKRIFEHGQWITLPGVVYTSARRFEQEGLKQRQMLNSFLCNFQHIGLHEFFGQASDAYRTQDHTTKLQLRPFLNIIHRLMMGQGITNAVKRWYKTGGYIAANAWQLAFAADCKRALQAGQEPGQGKTPRLKLYDCCLAPIITSPPCHAITALLTLIWFYSLFITEKTKS